MIAMDNSTGLEFEPVSTEGNDTQLNVTGLLPGTVYVMSVRAISEVKVELGDEVIGRSGLSNTDIATTGVTGKHTLYTCRHAQCKLDSLSLSITLVPAPNCTSAVSSNGNITVTWDYIHTGGLQLTAVQVEYSFQSLLVEVTRPAGDTGVNDRSLVVPELLTGQVYTFKVTATNSEGSASSECPPVDHRIGLYQPLLKPVHQVCMSYCHGLCNNICVMFSLLTHTHTHTHTHRCPSGSHGLYCH